MAIQEVGIFLFSSSRPLSPVPCIDAARLPRIINPVQSVGSDLTRPLPIPFILLVFSLLRRPTNFCWVQEFSPNPGLSLSSSFFPHNNIRSIPFA